MYLERLALEKAEKCLLPHRETGRQMILQSSIYQNYFSEIEKCLTEATYWHGTGRFHYANNGSRYGQIETDKTTDVLDSIIVKGGLIPHHDPWINSAGATVSLGTVRMHSKVFARLHLHEHDTLKYELGDFSFWLQLYAKLLFLWGFTDYKSFYYLSKNLVKRSTFGDIQTWAGSIRKPYQGKRVIGIYDLLKANIPGSDIAGNYPILIGIKNDLTPLIDTIPLTHTVEVRSLSIVTLDKFSHLEVPLNKLEETQVLLKQSNINLPVLPMEMVDVYLSQRPLSELAYN
jgi:hypothetical protein